MVINIPLYGTAYVINSKGCDNDNDFALNPSLNEGIENGGNKDCDDDYYTTTQETKSQNKLG